MTLIQSILMGFLQGLTEFLPVSSSGHLAIFKALFHVETETGLLFDVLLHVGTLAAVFIVYYKHIWKLILAFFQMVGDCFKNLGIFFGNIGKSNQEKKAYHKIVRDDFRKFVVLIIVSTFFTGILGILLSDFTEWASTTLFIPGICLIITSIELFISDRIKDGNKKPKKTSYGNATVMGIAQGIATLPGLSRSGTTIATGLLLGFDRGFAVEYSFIMSIPAILGAAVLELKDFGEETITGGLVFNYVIGMLVAFVVGYICIRTMLVIVRKKKFTYFSIYCLAIGILCIAANFFI